MWLWLLCVLQHELSKLYNDEWVEEDVSCMWSIGWLLVEKLENELLEGRGIPGRNGGNGERLLLEEQLGETSG